MCAYCDSQWEYTEHSGKLVNLFVCNKAVFFKKTKLLEEIEDKSASPCVNLNLAEQRVNRRDAARH